MVTIQVRRGTRLSVDKSILQRTAQFTLESIKPDSPDELSIVIGDDKLLHKLNRKYRQIDSPTDVLSFSSGEMDQDTSAVYLGDIIISLPRAEYQASTEGHPLLEELQLLVVHGTLHLLDYDHLDDPEKKRMQDTQNCIVKQLGLNIRTEL